MPESVVPATESKPSFFDLFGPNYRAIKSWGIMSSFAAACSAFSNAWRCTSCPAV